MGFQGISQPIVQYTAPFILQVRILTLHRFNVAKDYPLIVHKFELIFFPISPLIYTIYYFFQM